MFSTKNVKDGILRNTSDQLYVVANVPLMDGKYILWQLVKKSETGCYYLVNVTFI